MPAMRKGEPLPSHDGGEYGLVLPFDSDDPEFARGVEVGLIWSELCLTGSYEGIVRGVNSEMVMRMASARSLAFFADELNDDWYAVKIG